MNTALPIGEWISGNEDETFEMGNRIGSALIGGEVILLDGPLGAGKTVFTKGLACALGIDPADVTSPSFTLVNKYKGDLVLYHLDLYRLEAGRSAAYAVDLDDLLDEKQALIVIEWAERLASFPLRKEALRISFTGEGDDPRRITIERLPAS